MMKKLIVNFALLLAACVPSAQQVLPTPTATRRLEITSSLDCGGATVAGVLMRGSNIILSNCIIRNANGVGVEVRGNNNIIRNVDIANVLYSYNEGQYGDADGIRVFGSGHVFDNVYIHDINQYSAGIDPHTDCWQTWQDSNRGGVAKNITIKNSRCILPFAGAALSKAFQTEQGASNWTIQNTVVKTPLAGLFMNHSGVTITNSTFVGSGIASPQGLKFLNTSGVNITKSVFTGFTNGIGAVYSDGAVTASSNCYWNNYRRQELWTDPLLVDYVAGKSSGCFGYGYFPLVTVTQTPTLTTTKTPTATPTETKPPTVIVVVGGTEIICTLPCSITVR